jgi:hypothetical protein
MTDENLNKWMEDVKLGEPLPESKGVVKAIHLIIICAALKYLFN